MISSTLDCEKSFSNIIWLPICFMSSNGGKGISLNSVALTFIFPLNVLKYVSNRLLFNSAASPNISFLSRCPLGL